MSNKRNVIVFIGPPGSGKGSLSRICADEFGWAQLSTGSLCRKHIANQTEIGKEIDFCIKSGKLVSDDLISSMVGEWLSENVKSHSGIILDGFPRTVSQARILSEMLRSKMPEVALKVIQLEASDDTVIDRLTTRFICKESDCQAIYSVGTGSALSPKKVNTCDSCSGELIRRVDDEESTAKHRLASYHDYEKNLVGFYSQGGIDIHTINVEKSLPHVFEDFKSSFFGIDE